MATRPGSANAGSALALAATCCALLAPAFIWSGCSPQRRFEVLSFFFDGVPDPSAPAFAAGQPLRESPTYSIHKPYAEERCSDCHTGRFNMQSLDSGICMKCHENVPTEQPRMHGPVAAMACLWCHSAHESAYAHLLKGPARQVCTACHEPALLDAQAVPEHADESVSCLQCHYGHGGVTRHFLRSDVRRPSAGASPPGQQR
ncbi:MAG: cytochrome c3 family protein [Phycisphaerales bacterium JB039]